MNSKPVDPEDLIPEIIEILKQDAKFADWHSHLSRYDKSTFYNDLEQSVLRTVLAAKTKFKQRWPAKGDKLVAKNNQIKHWFRSVTENCAKLEIGREYTVKNCEVASSWCAVELEELDGDFSLAAFEWDY